MIKNKLGYRSAVVISAATWLLFVWLHTFTFLTCYEGASVIYRFLWGAVFAMLMTLLCWFCLKPDNNPYIFGEIFEEDEDYFIDAGISRFLQERADKTEWKLKRWSILQKSMFLVAIMSLIFLLAFIFEKQEDITFFTTDEYYIDLVFFAFDKKYMYDPILFIILPVWMQTIFRGMRKENYIRKSVVSGCVQILMLSLMSFFLFKEMPNIWLIELAAVEIIIVITGIKKYLWKTGKKSNIIALLIIYVIFWCVLLSVLYRPGQTLAEYSYGGDWGEYKEIVSELLAGASAFGASADLAHNMRLSEFLLNRNNYLLSALYYGGWAGAGFVIVLLVLFLAATRKLLGKHAKYNYNYLVYAAAWWGLSLRVIMGIFYSFGLLAMPIALPFAGTIGIYMDTMALGILFCSAVEARRIDASICKDCRIRDLYENDHVEISEAEYGGGQGLPYLVQVRSGETAYECIAEEEPQFNVLVLMLFAKKGNWLLILEKDDETDKWHDVEDEEIRRSVRYNVMSDICPECMEVFNE